VQKKGSVNGIKLFRITSKKRTKRELRTNELGTLVHLRLAKRVSAPKRLFVDAESETIGGGASSNAH